MSFESPIRRGRTVVALMASDAAAARSLVAALEDNARVSQIRGGLAVVRNDGVQSFAADEVYYVGSLTFWQWLWFHFAHHALLLIIVALALAVAVALLLYGGLQRLVSARLEGRAGK